jgi:hypothetical protein
MDSEQILFIVVGVVIVFGVGQLLIRSGRRYLAGSAPGEKASAGPAASLVAALFHLLTLGVVALISVLSIGSDAQTRFLVQVGVFLVVLAGVYAVALVQINRRREEALVAEAEAHDPYVSPTQQPEPGLRIRPVDPSSADQHVADAGPAVAG